MKTQIDQILEQRERESKEAERKFLAAERALTEHIATCVACENAGPVLCTDGAQLKLDYQQAQDTNTRKLRGVEEARHWKELENQNATTP